MEIQGKAAFGLRDILEQEIVERRLMPGQRLDETSLAERFSVSRTPIREALHALASSGLVEIKPRRGAFVRKISARELVEMFEVMAELEASCGRFACQRMTAVHEADLVAALESCEAAAKTGDVEHYYAENERFHAAIYTASCNAFLEQQALALQNRLKPFRRHQLNARGRMKQSLGEHREIANAIIAGDQDRVGPALRGHIVVQGEKFTSLIAALESADLAGGR